MGCYPCVQCRGKRHTAKSRSSLSPVGRAAKQHSRSEQRQWLGQQKVKGIFLKACLLNPTVYKAVGEHFHGVVNKIDVALTCVPGVYILGKADIGYILTNVTSHRVLGEALKFYGR